MKAVVLDVDETLGYFTDFGVLWKAINDFRVRDKMPRYGQNVFNYLLDKYPEFLRPNIQNILTYLKIKKMNNSTHKVILYTNNQAGAEWIVLIKKYLETKINYKLIDEVIGPYKIKNVITDFRRTSRTKTYYDLIKCAKISTESHICYIDDMEYNQMVNKNVLYIKVKPYYYFMNTSEIIHRFLKCQLGVQLLEVSKYSPIPIEKFIMNYFVIYKDKIKKGIEERRKNKITFVEDNMNNLEIDKSISEIMKPKPFVYDRNEEVETSKKIMEYLKDFFYNRRNKTGKRKLTNKNRTCKNNITKKKHNIVIK